MSIEELEKKCKELGDEIAKFKAAKDYPRFKPKVCDTYWCNSENGDTQKSTWTENLLDNSRFEFGNCYETREKAEKAAKQNKIYNLMRAYDDNGGSFIFIDKEGCLRSINFADSCGIHKFKNPSKVIDLIGKDLIIDAWKRD